MESKGPWFRAQPQSSHFPLTQLERQSALEAHIVYYSVISFWHVTGRCLGQSLRLVHEPC
ncbi:uncharacterized protein N7473_001154 [Penicillium subrubescens]|uniref:uncharacterized protein n=1 Tax=Penicillium subrubescens TaxID=1316194 RepID=UPI002545604D|nr:uncharacterized protein N7473_001154 [Penicillium subrubescens]KAJ5911851.1 hypothetical protein N7473_001154 [Penicillium subrubescens]